MKPRGGEPSPKRLLELTIGHCRKLSIAKKEKLELDDLCADLSRRLGDRSLILKQPNFDNFKSKLVEVEGQLAVWSNYGFLKRSIKRGTIKAGIRTFTANLRSIAFGSPVIPPAHGANTHNGRGGRNTLPPGGAGNLSPVIATNRSNHQLLPRQTSERGSPESHSVEANQPPPVRRLDGEVTRLGDIPFAEGRYCEVWMGLWEKGGEETGNKKVAMKVLRTLKPPGRGEKADKAEMAERAERARKRLERELPSWAELRHPNILPFYGTVTTIGTRLYMVFPWRENGNLLAYVKEHPKEDKNRLLRGSAAGLSYLHLRGFVHGSVRCSNVLISHEGEPQICDFGIAKIVHETHENTVSKTVSSATIIRYAAPELIKQNDFPVTTYSDTYSFALLILECITEAPPFSNISGDAAVIHARISKEQCPSRPEGRHRISDDLWDFMNRCWSIVPSHRPSMDHVHRFFLDRA